MSDDGDGLRLVPGEDLEPPLAADPPTRDEMLEAVPVDVEIAEGVNLDAADPAHDPTRQRRFCISTRRAGGRCTAPPLSDGLLCGIHAGTLEPRVGALASAEKRRNQAVTQEERTRLGRLGTRAAIADQIASDIVLVRAALHNLARLAAGGDRQAALALVPYLNQGLGMPTERVSVESDATPLSERSTADLAAIVARRRERRDTEPATG